MASPAASGLTPQAPTGLVEIAGVGTVQVAAFGQRLTARIIDLFILAGLYALLTFSTLASDSAIAFSLMFPTALLISLLYEWLTIAFAGATVGKMMMGLSVIDQRNGGLLGPGPAFVRQLIPFVGFLFLVLGAILVYLSPLFDNSGRLQGWHDKAANDLVIKTKD